MPTRCAWCTEDPLYIAYHDREWGVPVRDDRKLFEFLILEGAQAGLSWITVLRKRENYRRALKGFDPTALALLTDDDIGQLMHDPGIVRNRLKLNAVRANARAFLKVQQHAGSFSDHVWSFVDNSPIVRRADDGIPTRTSESDALSDDLKKRGFKFVGTTICYAFMQACGLVNDHAVHCFRRRELMEAQRRDGPASGI